MPLISPQSVLFFSISVPITIRDSDGLWFWHIGFHAVLSPRTVTARRLVCDRTGKITARHMGLYNKTLKYWKASPVKLRGGMQRFKPINNHPFQINSRDVGKYCVHNWTTGWNDCWSNGKNNRLSPLGFRNPKLFVRQITVLVEQILCWFSGVIWKWLMYMSKLSFLMFSKVLLPLSLKLSHNCSLYDKFTKFIWGFI